MHKLDKAQAKALSRVAKETSNISYYLRGVEHSAKMIREGMASVTHVSAMDSTAAVDLRTACISLGKAIDMTYDVFPDMHEDNVTDLINKARRNAATAYIYHYSEGEEV